MDGAVVDAETWLAAYPCCACLHLTTFLLASFPGTQQNLREPGNEATFLQDSCIGTCTAAHILLVQV